MAGHLADAHQIYLNGVILVQSIHYFPFILINLSASLNNIDRAMEESAQNLGASGLRLFRRIVFPLAMPGYIAGAALVFLKVFDDLGTPLLLNVNNMLAPQAYLRISSIGISDPMGYVISVILVLFSLFALWTSFLAMRGRDYASIQKGGGGLMKRDMRPAEQFGAYLVVTLILLLVLLLSLRLRRQPGVEAGAQLQQGLGALLGLQSRLGDNILVKPDRAIDLAAAPEQVAERHVRFDGVLVDVGEFEKNFDRLVRLLVEQVIQALEILVAEQLPAAPGGTPPERSAHPPAEDQRPLVADDHQPSLQVGRFQVPADVQGSHAFDQFRM